MNYREIFTLKRLWMLFGVLLVVMFGVLLLVGGRAFREAPPMPEQVVATADDAAPRVVFDSDDIRAGRDVWRRLGGMQLGSVWGHGGYLAPDWTTDVLHREALAMLDADGRFAALPEPDRAARIAALAARIRVNSWDAETGRIAVSPERARAIESVVAHYTALFGGAGDGPEAQALREAHGIPERPLGLSPDAEVRQLVAWWWWTAWAAVTLRPDDNVTYTNNWPHEPLVGNRPSAATFIWTFVSVVLLIAGAGALCWFFLRERDEWLRDAEPSEGYPGSNPIAAAQPTASMRGVAKYIWTVALMLALQIALGAVTAHFAVEGQDFYGLPLSEVAPYAADADLARAARRALDRDSVAGRGPVSGADDRGVRATRPATRRRRAVGGARRRRRRLADRRVADPDRAALPTLTWSTGSATRATSSSTWDGSGKCSSSRAF